MSKGNRKKIAVMIIIMLICILAVLAFVYYINSKGKSAPKTLDSTAANQSADGAGGKSEKQFDENNIGELYYSPVDEEHIAEDESGVMYSDNEILLVSNDGVSRSDIEALAEKYGAEIVGWIEQTGDYQLKFSEAYTLEELDKLAEDIQNEDVVYSAYANYICEASEDNVIDYDINIGDKWTKNFLKGAISILSKDTMWGAKAINAPQAWYAMDLLKENIEPVKVGLIDSGFDENHEDLKFAENGIFYSSGKNSNEDKKIDTNKNPKDHGTHVAGTMAARGDNKEGICGIYPYSSGRLYGSSWAGAGSYEENKISSMYEKVAFTELIMRNVKVINCSYGNVNHAVYYNDEKTKSEISSGAEILADLFQRLIDMNYDFVIVTAAGNASDDVVVNLKHDENGYVTNGKTIAYDPNGVPTIVVANQSRTKYYYQETDAEGKTVNYEVTGITNRDDQTFIAKDDITDGHLDAEYSSSMNAIPNNKAYKKVYDRIIVVGAVNKSLGITDYTEAGNRVDIFAPGGDESLGIYSTVPGSEYSNKDWYGTSMASPHVAGVCADVWSMNKYLTGAEVKEIVCGSTLDDVVVYTTPNGESRGVVDANKAVAEAHNRLATSGRIIKEPENGAILGWVVEKDNEDEKIKKADVTAVSESGNSDEYTDETDEYGHFELILPKGDYTITVKAKGYKDFTFDVKLANNGEVVYPDWVKMEKKLTKAEKYAKIVMDNEDLWLKPFEYVSGMEDTYYFEPNCWFEDLDFDGELEFIIGGFNMGTQGGINYAVYKFSGEKMVKQKFYYTDDSKSSTDNLAAISPNPGLKKVGGEAVKTKSGEYKYILPYTFAYIGNSTAIGELSFSDNCLISKKIAGYWENSRDIDYWTMNNNEATKSELISYIDNYFDGMTACNTNIGTIPCTQATAYYDAEFYKDITSGDAQLSDGQTVIVSACYDNLSDKEKMEALIRSYKAYSISDGNNPPMLYTKLRNELENIE